MKIENLTLAERKKLAVKKISFSFDNTPEQKLMFSILSSGITDEEGVDENYFKGLIPHAEICNVDSDYVRHVLRKTGVIDINNSHE